MQGKGEHTQAGGIRGNGFNKHLLSLPYIALPVNIHRGILIMMFLVIQENLINNSILECFCLVNSRATVKLDTTVFALKLCGPCQSTGVIHLLAN